MCSECELISDTRLAEEIQKQQELLLKLAELKRKQEETRFNIELIKIMLESCPSSILSRKSEADLQNQVLLRDFVISHKDYFNGETFLQFKKNLPILASIDELPKNKKIRNKITSILCENMEIEHTLRYTIEFERMENLFMHSLLVDGIKDITKIRISPKVFGRLRGGMEGGWLLPPKSYNFLERHSVLPNSIRFENEGWGLEKKLGCFFVKNSILNAGDLT